MSTTLGPVLHYVLFDQLSIIMITCQCRWTALISLILSFQMFICSLSFGTFTVNMELPQNRLQLSFILLLTTITFKFIVNQSLPRISYLTYMVSRSDCPYMLSE